VREKLLAKKKDTGIIDRASARAQVIQSKLKKNIDDLEIWRGTVAGIFNGIESDVEGLSPTVQQYQLANQIDQMAVETERLDMEAASILSDSYFELVERAGKSGGIVQDAYDSVNMAHFESTLEAGRIEDIPMPEIDEAVQRITATIHQLEN